MPALSRYENVDATAVELILEHGFQVWRAPDYSMFYAEKDGWDFWAEDPCALLGLITIYHHLRPAEYREYWWRIEEPNTDLVRELPTDTRPFVSVVVR